VDEYVKIVVFRACVRQKWIDLRQTKTKMINGPFYTYRQIHFTSGNGSFVINACNPGGRMSQQPSGRVVPTCFQGKNMKNRPPVHGTALAAVT